MMAKEFLLQFAGMPLTVGQTLVFQFQDKKLLGLVVKKLEAIDAKSMQDAKDGSMKSVQFGRVLGNSVVQYEKAENSSLNLTGKAKGYVLSFLFKIFRGA